MQRKGESFSNHKSYNAVHIFHLWGLPRKLINGDYGVIQVIGDRFGALERFSEIQSPNGDRPAENGGVCGFPAADDVH